MQGFADFYRFFHCSGKNTFCNGKIPTLGSINLNRKVKESSKQRLVDDEFAKYAEGTGVPEQKGRKNRTDVKRKNNWRSNNIIQQSEVEEEAEKEEAEKN